MYSWILFQGNVKLYKGNLTRRFTFLLQCWLIEILECQSSIKVTVNDFVTEVGKQDRVIGWCYDDRGCFGKSSVPTKQNSSIWCTEQAEPMPGSTGKALNSYSRVGRYRRSKWTCRLLRCRRLKWYHLIIISIIGIFISTSLLFGSSINIGDHMETIRQVEVKAKDVIDHPLIRYADDGQHLKGNRRALAAFGTLPERIRLQELQREILLSQKRPPDSTYNINVSLSDAISVDREIEDTRPTVCKDIHYDIDKMPAVSIVIPFYNEALSMLLRTVHSILNRTPNKLLAEIILVDDCSTNENLREPLDRYIELLPKVKLKRNKVREGLIRSRLMGEESTAASLVVFLDAHTEVNNGWLEPIIDQLQKHPNR